MSIKPGSLVMLLPTPNPDHNRRAGEIHTVARRGTHAWLMEGIPFFEWSERYLKEIGTPGDNEQDETLSWRRVPLRATTVQ